MKLNKIEKIIIAVILLGLILVGGTFLFVMPSFQRIEKESKTLASNIKEKEQLDEKLARLDTIDADIEATKNDALKYEGSFYPDLKSYEASEIAMAYLKESGLETHGIQVTSLSTRPLTLEYFLPRDVEYDLKSYSSAANTETGDDALVEGEFLDNNKKYSISISSVTDVTIVDDSGNIIDPSKYTDTMKKMYTAAVCKYAVANGVSQTVAFTQATYTVKGKYSDYAKFIDHIYSLERATTFERIMYPMTMTIDEDKDSETAYVGEDGRLSVGSEANGEMVIVNDDTEVEEELTIIFMSVEPMNALKTVQADGTSVVVDQRPAVY